MEKETSKKRGRPASPPPSYEHLKKPNIGFERNIDLINGLVTNFFEDPNLASGEWSQSKVKKIAKAVQVLQENQSITEIDGARNEMKKYQLNPDNLEDRKLAYLISIACSNTIDYLEVVNRGTLGASEANTGANFSQAWKMFFEELIVNQGYSRDQSFKIFDTVFDNNLVLDALAEKNRIMLVNGLEAELSVFWFLKEKNYGEVKFADRDLDEKNGIDLVLLGQNNITYFQVKSSNKFEQPKQFDVLNNLAYKEYCLDFIDKVSNKDHRLKLESGLNRFVNYIQKEKNKDPFKTINGVMFISPVRPGKWEIRKNTQQNFKKLL